ncbi:unnamed protein product [Owenia fusiformis]|uniref:C2 domain-containing protein n=1 Tax=Owenia fusiformis TaxID=6347 RepID=A0A8S4NXJ4_OWEFU|nr:unnamed protein product [Owenia fusiformis]
MPLQEEMTLNYHLDGAGMMHGNWISTGAVDEEGWEYTVEATIGGYGPVEKRYHMCRRRRWVRTRTLTADIKTQVEDEELEKEAAEGWEYAPLFNMKFHAKERRMDLVRRRRWHRKMVSQDSSEHGACFFEFQNQEAEGKDKEKYEASMSAPRMFLTFTKPPRYQLRAYIYQARDLLAADANGLSDPFARICFLNQSDVTEKIMKTLCPTWDQTLIFEQVAIHGDPEVIAKNPPEIVIELFDHDNFGEAEFLGRTVCKPIVKLTPDDSRTALLQWHSVTRGNQEGGELLASFELFLMNGSDLPFLPPKRGNLYQVPSGIRPIMQRTAIEALCWGVRNMKKFQLANVTSPSVQFEIGGHVMQSHVIKNTKHNPNFSDPVLFFDVLLPKEELYTPPMNIRIRDNRPFGRKPLVGVHVEKSLEKYRCSPIITELPDDAITDIDGVQTPTGETIVDMPPEKTPSKETELLELDIDWWSKYYASTGELSKCRKYLEKGYDKIEVFGTALEQVDGYNDFNDFCSAFEFSRGKNNDDEESNIVGELKATFKVYPLPEDPKAELPPSMLKNLPSSDPEECVVRVYIIKAINLQPNDPNGLADPYVEIKLGGNKENNRDNYIPNTLDPVFGHMFEMKAMLPMQKDLRIRVMDYDLISSDDIIGETMIDLENRFLTKWNALVGLPKSYCTSGPCAWRDSRKPKALLNEYCEKNHLDPPHYYGNSSLKIRGKVYALTDFELNKPIHGHLGPADERLALYVLNTLPFVPEHVETRSLFNPLQPNIEQGKLQMFVDVFPQSFGEPGPPIDIAPRKARRYVLRIIIRNTNDVILEEESITGEKMSDIYVKGWVAGIDEKQRTDIHYRSLDGDGNFNWRFVFPFDFLPAEQTMVVRKKEHFWSLDETEQHLAPILMIQIWDNDKFSADDFLGTLELNLNSMPKPAKKCSACSLKQLPDLSDVEKKTKMISLFEQKRLYGFWPCYSEDSGERVLTGKVEMEMELLTEEDAEARPAGQGRDEPNMNPKLEEPKRPETSFLWFSSPLKTLKYILWRNYKWLIIGFIIVLLLLLIIFLFVYAFPGAIAEKIVNL